MTANNGTWRIAHLICSGLVAIAFFLPAFKVSFLGLSMSASFSQMTFGGELVGEGGFLNIIFLLIPLAITVLSAVKLKFTRFVIYPLSVIGFLLLFIYFGEEMISLTIGFWLMFFGYIAGVVLNTLCLITWDGTSEINRRSDFSASFRPSGTATAKTVNASYSDRTCANCGAPLTSDSRFCENCGAPVEEPQPQVRTEEENASYFCPNCGKPYKAGDKFCMGCGTKL